ncbi:hypothetical protein [Actinomadura xylanilytica]|uniref:hypothetical protein n=1 Tax=Actinomadura xylanilytica TaxID=887459 RepID=UPI00255A8F31|nr:hypothetical protein [Actinomadura xylanilytica]MDL4773662.1 hypothetical protein [Actinomadura xylanilytica]
MTESTSLDPDEQNELIQSVGRSLVREMPDDWQSISFTFNSLVGVDTASILMSREKGGMEPAMPSMKAMEIMEELRSGMYQPGKGAWFVARYELARSGRYSVDFDYDSEPEFEFPIAPSSYAEDLEYFPRDDQNVPLWLRQKLDEVQNG